MNTSSPFTGPRESDVASVENLVTALYDAISGPIGERDWDRIRHFYLPGARLIPTGTRPNGEHGLRILTVEEWIESARPLFARQAFFEVEIDRRIDRFGQIAQVFSTYEYRFAEDEPGHLKGINSFQLLHKDGRWWIVTVFWDNESEGNRIPAEYL